MYLTIKKKWHFPFLLVTVIEATEEGAPGRPQRVRGHVTSQRAEHFASRLGPGTGRGEEGGVAAGCPSVLH